MLLAFLKSLSALPNAKGHYVPAVLSIGVKGLLAVRSEEGQRRQIEEDKAVLSDFRKFLKDFFTNSYSKHSSLRSNMELLLVRVHLICLL